MQATVAWFTETQPVSWQVHKFGSRGYLQKNNTVLPNWLSVEGRERKVIWWLPSVFCLLLVMICPIEELALVAAQKVRSHFLLHGNLWESGSRNSGGVSNYKNEASSLWRKNLPGLQSCSSYGSVMWGQSEDKVRTKQPGVQEPQEVHRCASWSPGGQIVYRSYLSLGCYNRILVDYVAYKQCKLIFHSSGSWEVQD